jgi:hypothetical protein
MAKPVYVPELGRVLSFPDEATDDQIVSEIRSMIPSAPAPEAAPSGPDESTILGRAAYGFATGFTDIPSGIAALAMPAEQVAKTTAGRFSEDARKYLQETFGIDPTKDPTAAQQAAEALGSVGSFLVPATGAAKIAALAGRGAKIAGAAGAAADALAAQRAARLAGSVTAAGQGVALGAAQRTQTIQQQLASGMEISPEDQLAAQRLDAFIGIAEAAPLERFFGPLTQILSKVPASKAPLVERIVKSRLSKITRAGVAEGAQEAASGIANDLVEYGVYNPDVEIGQDLLSNAGTGAFAGSFVEGVIQLAAGRRLRGARQLQQDIAAEKQQNAIAARQGLVSDAAEKLRQYNIDGPVEVVEDEIENVPIFSLKTPAGNVIGEFADRDSLNEAVGLYNAKTGAKVEIREPAKIPDIFPVKIGKKKFDSLDAVRTERDNLISRIQAAKVLATDPIRIKEGASKIGVPEPLYQKKAQANLDKLVREVEPLEAFVFDAEPALKPEPVGDEVGPDRIKALRGRIAALPTLSTTEDVVDESKRIKESTGAGVALQYPSYKAFLDTVRQAGLPDEEVASVTGIRNEEDFLRVREDEISQYVEEPAKNALRRVYERGGSPYSSNAFGPGLKGVLYEDKDGTKKLEPISPEDYGGSSTAPVEAVSAVEPSQPIGVAETAPAPSGEGIAAIPEPPSISEEITATGPTPVDTTEQNLSAGLLPEVAAPRKPVRQIEAETVTPRDYTPERKALDQKVYSELRTRLSSIVPAEVVLKVRDVIDTQPGYLVRGFVRSDGTANDMKVVVEIAQGIINPSLPIEDNIKALMETLNHEIIHVVRRMGLIRPAEWNILSRAARSAKVPGKKYTYLDKAEAVYAPNGEPITPEYADPEVLLEEAVAEMYKDWVINRTAPKNTAGLFNRITEFFRRIFRTLKSNAQEAVFKRIESGEVGQREAAPIESGERFSSAPISVDRKSLIERKKVLLEQMRPMAEKGVMTGPEAVLFMKLGNEISGIMYDLSRTKPLNPEKVATESERMSTLPKEVVVQAYNDALADRDVFIAMNNASFGTANDAITDVDRLLAGPKGAEMYRSFAPTRDAIRRAFGEKIRLYRAEGKQRKKATQNWATTREYAKQFGNNVIEKDIPVENILAVNVGSGNYHEIIVGEPPTMQREAAPVEAGERFSAAPLPSILEQKNKALFAPAPKKSFKDMIFDFFLGEAPTETLLTTEHGQKKIKISALTRAALIERTAAVDRNAMIEFLEKQENLLTTGDMSRLTADYSPLVSLLNKDRASHLFAAAMLRGNIAVNKLKTGDILSATLKVEDSPDSLMKVFELMLQPGPPDPATNEPRDKRHIFRLYASAMRAIGLKAEGKRVPKELDDITVKTTIDFTEKNYPEVVEAYKMYQRFNRSLLKAAVDAELITPESFANLTKRMDYYGYYYEVFEEVYAPGMPKKVAGRFNLRPYKGTELGGLANDPMQVMLQNSMFWTEAIAKNLAARKSFELAKRMGVARLLNTGEDPDRGRGEEDQVMFFRDKGVDKRFAVSDPLLVSALGSDDRIDVGKFWEMIGLPTQYLREFITRDPGFMVANLMRDTLSAWITSGADIMPFIGTVKGFANAYKNGASFQALQGRGVVGSYDLAMLGPAELAKRIRSSTKPKGVTNITGPGALIGVVGSLWNRLGAVSEMSDAATRIAVYESAIKQGFSEAEAAFRALEIMNFSRRGASQTLSILTKLVPFLNARIQGLDVLYQAGKGAVNLVTGRQQGQRDADLGKKFLIRGGMLAAISVALEMLNDDDEDYQQLDDYIKNSNVLIPLAGFGLKGQFIAVPKPFEAGLLFSTFPQQFYKTATGQASTRENAALFFSSFASTFGVNPIPQFMLPPLEVIVNHDFYTGLPLISEGKARLAPELQYNSSTSSLAMMIGKVPIKYNFTTGKFEGVSPIVIDNLISGYTGPFGTYIVQAASLAMEGVDAGPERLPRSVSQLPVVRRFFIDSEYKNPKVVSQAYELFRVVDEANRSYSRLRQIGDAEAVKDYLDENRDILSYKKYVFKLVDGLNKLSAQERRIESDQTMTREEKFEAMAKLRETRMKLAAKVTEINAALGR